MTFSTITATLGTLVVALTLSGGCSTTKAHSSEGNEMPTDSAVLPTSSEWDATAARSIFFGHQSVGENIIDGLKQVAAVEGWKPLRIEEIGTTAPAGPGLFHTKIGQNGDPSSKVKAFRQSLEGGVGDRVDIALMKFCFWDIRANTDADAVFKEYRDTMADLQRRYPKVTFVYATVPLVVMDADWRAQVRRLFRMTVPMDADNLVRDALSRKIRAEYGARGPLFDIAALEEAGAAPVPYLADDLSSDGAHLNTAGRRRLAAGFVKTLSAAAARHAAEQAQ